MTFRPYPKVYTMPKVKTQMKKERTDDTGKLRKKLDLLFSRMVKKGMSKCYTCESERASECGHYQKRGNDATRWDFDNARPQGFYCNRVLGGNVDEFRKRLVAEIGEYRVAEVERKARLDVKFSAPELQEMIEQYSKK